jgi:hypothetical protein
MPNLQTPKGWHDSFRSFFVSPLRGFGALWSVVSLSKIMSALRAYCHSNRQIKIQAFATMHCINHINGLATPIPQGGGFKQICCRHCVPYHFCLLRFWRTSSPRCTMGLATPIPQGGASNKSVAGTVCLPIFVCFAFGEQVRHAAQTKIAPLGGIRFVWRRERDSNPRYLLQYT